VRAWVLVFLFALVSSCQERTSNTRNLLLLLPLLPTSSSSSSGQVCPGANAIRSAFLADLVVSSPGANLSELYGNPALATNGVCGGGEFQGSVDVYSLNPPDRNQITLSWTDRTVANGSGIDFLVFENAFRYLDRNAHFIEPTIVEVSRNNSVYCGWNPRYIGRANNEADTLQRSSWSGIAGRNPVLWNQVNNPLSHSQIFSSFDEWGASRTAGGDGFDLMDLFPGGNCTNAEVVALQTSGFRFLRLTSGVSLQSSLGIPIPPGNFSGGPDIDGVLARSFQN